MELMKNGNQNFSRYLLRNIDEDGTEYFTVKRTGQSGMSHSGLARFVGKHQAAISSLVRKIKQANSRCNELPECLQPFIGKDLKLKGYYDPRGREILHDGFCAAAVEYYARYAKHKTPEDSYKAKQALSLIQNVGMRFFIHKKTGWQPKPTASNVDFFDQEFEAHKGRYSVRQILRFEDDPELRSAINQYRQENRLSKMIFSATYDEMNKLLQGVTSRQIKQQNNLSKSALIRDHYDTRPLMDYSAITRLTTNQIRHSGLHPVDAVRRAFDLLYPEHTPQLVPVIENVYKADRRLKAEVKRRRLAQGVQLSLLNSDSENSDPQVS